MEEKYDIVIIGSGLGGLECGVILSKEGYNVCVLEQAEVFGGCFQSFQRKGHTLDTGIHYVGSMGEGQIMRQYLKYFGIFDQLDVVPLDDAFEELNLDGEQYLYRTGYPNFIKELVERFPHQKEGIERYCQMIRQIGDSISVDVHKTGKFATGEANYLNVSAVAFIKECVSDPMLQNVLAGTNFLYGATADTANLYHHAMINHSNIEGSYRFVGGTQKVADALVAKIRENGGTVRNNAKVTRLAVEGGEISHLELANGERIEGKSYISAIHPMTTFEMVDQTPHIKKAYRTRLRLLKNTYGFFSVYLLMEKDKFPYQNYNRYFFSSKDVWNVEIDPQTLQANAVMLSPHLNHPTDQYSNVVSLLSPISHETFAPFAHTSFGKRGADYRTLKKQITENILAFTAQYCPEIVEHSTHIFTASPLTYQHYTGVPQGSAYGILKSYQNSITTHLPTKTKLSNLFLTGQNLNVHGALGVTLTASATCSEFIGTAYLAKKVGQS